MRVCSTFVDTWTTVLTSISLDLCRSHRTCVSAATPSTHGLAASSTASLLTPASQRLRSGLIISEISPRSWSARSTAIRVSEASNLLLLVVYRPICWTIARDYPPLLVIDASILTDCLHTQTSRTRLTLTASAARAPIITSRRKTQTCQKTRSIPTRA